MIKFIATFFYVGNIPPAPGTLASAITVIICYLLRDNTPLYLLCLLGVLVLGFLTAGRAEKILGKKDPGCIVIDEVCGVMITFLALPFSWPVIFTAFFLFRAFDMFKIFPARQMELKGGAFGIMMDDIVAGIYTNIVMQIAIRLAGI